MNSDLFMDKATRHTKNVLAQAFQHAALQGTKVVTPLHLLYALVCEAGCIGEEILRRSGLQRETLATLMNDAEAITLHRTIILSPNAKRAIEKAVMRAAKDNHPYIGTEHLLYGLIEIQSADIEFVLESSGTKRKELEQQLDIALKSAGKLNEMVQSMWGAQRAQHTQSTKQIEKQAKQKNPALDYFGAELTNKQTAEKTDPVIGRDEEIERLIHVLARRTKNNPLLLGDPGVGKTAIVEGLAKRIVEGAVPPTLIGKRIFAIDLGLMVAGTMYRGEFESRVKQLVDEVKANPDIILFIDEVHSIVGAGSSSGTLDAANLLKPALARGELHVIGATTFDEFKKHIEHDAALERRFQPIQVREPSADETREMLAHIKGHYERFHGVSVADEAIEIAVRMAGKYFPEKRFPDKAIDLLDEAMSSVKVKSANMDNAVHQNKIRASLRDLDTRKQKAVLKEDYEEAQKIKEHEQRLLVELYTLEQAENPDLRHGVVLAADVLSVLSRMLRRPLHEQQLEKPAEHKESVTAFLRNRIFGQDETIKTIATALTKAQLGLNGENRPLASFLFVGSTGVGKTELAKLIAESVYHDPKALIRMDMTEFSEGFSVSKMLGAPAGYVGYRESTTLVDRLRRQPMSVLLFDEVDKAHPDVLNVLLQMLEEGRITDSSGKEASVKQAIIILTYQVPVEEISGSSFGFGSAGSKRPAEEVRASLHNVIRPELLNRIDHICVFNPMSRDALAHIAIRGLENLQTRLDKKMITLSWDETVPAAIAAQADEPKEGARRVRQIIDQQVERPLIEQITENPAGQAYRIGVTNAILVVEPAYGRSSTESTRRRAKSGVRATAK